MIHEYAAIDPMALLFPSRLYIELSEKLHPQVPKSVEIKEALGHLICRCGTHNAALKAVKRAAQSA